MSVNMNANCSAVTATATLLVDNIQSCFETVYYV